MWNPFRRKEKGVGPSFRPLGWEFSNTTPTATSAYQSFRELEETGKSFDHLEHLDTKRAQIALRFVNWYLIYIAVVVIGVPLFNALLAKSHETIDVYKLLTQVGTLLGSPLGFVVGYYFKEENKS